jgi:hypothetical protein
VPAAVGGDPPTPGSGAGPENASIHEERREILASVLVALAANSPPDPDEMAACSHLLKHLAETAGRWGHQGPPARPSGLATRPL